MAKKQKVKVKEPKVSARVMRTIQESMPFIRMHPTGILETGDGFSKCYSFMDANYELEEQDKQEAMLLEWEKFLNHFKTSVSLQIVLINKKISSVGIEKNYLIPLDENESTDEGLNKLRKEYNDIVLEKIKEGENDFERQRYIVLTLKCDKIDTALREFVNIDKGVKECLARINKDGGKPLNCLEYSELLYEIYNGNKRTPFRKLSEAYIGNDEDLSPALLSKKGTTLKNMIAPSSMEVKSEYILLNRDRYVASNMVTQFPPFLETRFLNDLSNIPYENIVCLTLKTLTRKKAQSSSKMQDNVVRGDVIEAQKRAFKQGYSPELIPENVKTYSEEATEIRHDVVIEGKKLFRASIMVSFFADSKERLDMADELLEGKFSDYSVNSTTCKSQQLIAFNSALPVGVKEVALDATLTSASCCAFNPFNMQELTDKQGIFYGINAVSKNMIMYDRKRSNLANGLVLGRAGSGKSFFIKGEIIGNFLKSDEDEVVILDPENEYGIVGERLGGVVVDVNLKANLHINPCDMDMEFGEEKVSPLTDKCDFMVGLVEAVMGRGRECNAYQVSAIHRATENMYASYMTEMERRYMENPNCESIDYELCPTLKDFYKELMALKDGEGTNIAMQIEPYCIGQYSVFAHHTSKEIYDNKARITVYNLSHMPEKMHEFTMKVLLSNIWVSVARNRIEAQKAKKMGVKYSKSVWCYLDEFHLFFKTESSATAIMSYYKRVRKYGGIMTGITQDISDLLDNRQGSAMWENSGFYVAMNQSKRGRDAWQSQLQCSDTMIDYLKDRGTGTGLIYNNTTIVPFDFHIPNDTEIYKMISTKPNED